MRRAYLIGIVFTALLAITALVGCTQDGPSAPPTPTDIDATPPPSMEPAPTTLVIPTGTLAPTPFPTLTAVATSEPSATPSAPPPAPTLEPSALPATATPEVARGSLSVEDLLAAWQPSSAHTLETTLDIDTPETGHVSLHVTREYAAGGSGDRITIAGSAGDQSIDLQAVTVAGETVVSRSGGAWTLATAGQVPEMALDDLAPALLADILSGQAAAYSGPDTVGQHDARRYTFPPEGIAANLAPRSLTLQRAEAEAWMAADGAALVRVVLNVEGRGSDARMYRVRIDASMRPADPSLTIAMPVPGSAAEAPRLERPTLIDAARVESLRLDATLQITATQPGTLALSYSYRSEPEAAQATLSVGVAGEEPNRMEILESDGETWLSQDGATSWQPYESTLLQILAEQDLAWLLAPQALTGELPAEPLARETFEGLAVLRYAVDAGVLLAAAPLGDITIQEGNGEVLIAEEFGIPVRLIVNASGLDRAGAPFALALTIAVSGLDGSVEIARPPADALAPAASAWPATLAVTDLEDLESLPSYRLFTTLSEAGSEGTMLVEVLGEVDTAQDAERLTVAARRGSELAFSDVIRRAGINWIDDGGTGEWVEATTAGESLPVPEGLSPSAVLASLGRAPGEFAGTQDLDGEETGRYTWDASALQALPGASALDARSGAEVWVSSQYRVPVRIALRTFREGSSSIVDLTVTDIGETLGIRPPEEQPCPSAASLQLSEAVSATVSGGARQCAKFVAPAGTLRTLSVSTVDPRLDVILMVYDADGVQRHYNDDGPTGYAPLLTMRTAQAGVYYAVLEAQDSRQSGDLVLRLTAFDGEGTATLDNAPLLVPGTSVDAALTAGSLLYLPLYEETIFGQAYALDSEAGSRIRVRVEAERLGSRLDPQVRLLSPRGEIVASDDDSLGGNDALLDYVLTETGRHYLVVNRASGDLYGTPDTHYYRIAVDTE